MSQWVYVFHLPPDLVTRRAERIMALRVEIPRGKLPPAKFIGQKHRSSGDMMFLVREEQDLTYSLQSAISIYI